MSSVVETAALSGRQVLDCLEGVVYATDLNGAITHVAPTGWERFAKENGAAPLEAPAVLGGVLFDFILGPDVANAYHGLHRAIVEGERSHCVFTYRCDAPSIKRVMRMSITRLVYNDRVAGVLYQSQLLQEHLRPASHRWIGGAGLEAPGAPVVAYCSGCTRVAWPDTANLQAPAAWISLNKFAAMGGPLPASPRHSICPDCKRRLSAH